MKGLGALLPAGLRMRLRAFRLARGHRRLDQCAAQVALLLSAAGRLRPQGWRIAELGCGPVPGHALCFHLLGAAQVVATDRVAVFQPAALAASVNHAHAAQVRDLLSPFAEHHDIRERLQALIARDGQVDPALFQFAVASTPDQVGRDYNLIYSLSVVEHVPRRELPAWFSAAASTLAPGGMMLHAIHLEDHRDPELSPFAFRSNPQYSFAEECERGNRADADELIATARQSGDVEVLWRWRRPGLAPVGDDTSHLGIMIRRP
ncbi:hypothetical protein LBMAG53_03470 [Planctomycetota bacterium]|nr:hypothetical protein LBMAG53_03470 [Planctomycetota bacterium]